MKNDSINKLRIRVKRFNFNRSLLDTYILGLHYLNNSSYCSKDLENLYLLSKTELKEYHELKNETRKQTYLLSRFFLKEIISNMFNIDPHLCKKSSGKPFIKNLPEINFSISHSKNMITLALAKCKLLGVDIELIQKRPNRWYSEWTAREALIKAKGWTLLEHYRAISFQKRNKKTVCLFKGKPIKSLKFKTLKIRKEYILSLAVNSSNSKRIKLVSLN